MSQGHYSYESSDNVSALSAPLPPVRMRTEGNFEEFEAVPPPPRLMQREIAEFKGPKFVGDRGLV